jgi:murein DD-endopeptidase MepM/ murein hydrolase activator NlpD
MVFAGPRHWLALGVCLALGCATSDADKPAHEDHVPGAWHIVEAGETPVTIAKRAGIPLEDFLELNGLRRNDVLAPGRPVFLFGRTQALAPPDAGTPPPPAASEPPAAPTVAPPAASAPLRWPVKAPRLTSRFGTRWGKPHEGIDMAAPIGTPVLAAAQGSVIYAGDQVRGYGNMVVVKHAEGLVTVYAHNSVVLVQAGDNVSPGQEIARVGDTGRSTAPHLHFEVRRRDTPQDPLQFLPALK